MLDIIMEKQRELQTRLGFDFSTMTNEERAAFMRDHRGFLADEIAEALYEMPNYKTWKDYSTMDEEARGYAWQKVRMELIDALHFFVNLLLCAGFTAEEVTEMYLAKNKENHRRQDAGYTADVSYRDQAPEEVLTSDVSHKALCRVLTDGNVSESTHFVAALLNSDWSITVSYNASEQMLEDVIGHLQNELNSIRQEEEAEVDE